MGKRSRFSIKRPHGSEMSLQITSMADIFMILLVFLLKSITMGGISLAPSPGLKLPQAGASGPAIDALVVEISELGVQLDNELVTPLKAFRFPAKERDDNGISRSLVTSFERQRKRQALIAKSNPDVQPDNKILVVADQRTPYVTLKSVISSAALHGYNDLKLVVVNKE